MGNPGSFHLVTPPFSTCGLQVHWKEEKEHEGSQVGGFYGPVLACSAHCPVIGPHLMARDAGQCGLAAQEKKMSWGRRYSQTHTMCAQIHGGTLPRFQWQLCIFTRCTYEFSSRLRGRWTHTQPEVYLHVHMSVQTHMHAHMLRSVEVHVYTHTHTLRDTCPGAQRWALRGCVTSCVHDAPPPLTLNPPWHLPLLCWCFHEGKGTVLQLTVHRCTHRLFAAGTGK